MTKLLKHMRRRMRLLLMAPLAMWTWTHRADLRRAVPVLTAAPKRMRSHELSDLFVEARVLLALGTDNRTRGCEGIELCEVRDGVARLRVDSAHEIDALNVVGHVSGVEIVEVRPPLHEVPPDGNWFVEPAFA